MTHGINKDEIKAVEFIKRFCFDILPESGILKLKNGQEISAKQFVENYMMRISEYDKVYTTNDLAMRLLHSESIWTVQDRFRKRLKG